MAKRRTNIKARRDKAKADKKRRKTAIITTILVAAIGFSMIATAVTQYGPGSAALNDNKTAPESIGDNPYMEDTSVKYSDEDSLPVCIGDEEGNLYYIVYTDNGDSILTVDAMPGFALDSENASPAHLDFYSEYGDHVALSNKYPDFCKDFYEGELNKASDDSYELVERDFKTKNSMESFGYDIWHNTDENVYYAVLPIFDEKHLTVMFESKNEMEDPVFNTVEDIKTVLAHYY